MGVLQSSWSNGQFIVLVVLAHLIFALLEKNRIESFEEKGEVSSCSYHHRILCFVGKLDVYFDVHCMTHMQSLAC